jgi:light-regulated signal transduction histidine kinase (bacteriophytochrome)
MHTRDQDHRLLQKAEEIAKLLARQYKDELSVSERQTLLEWMHRQNPSTRKYLDRISDRAQIERDLQTLASIDVDSALADVRQRILSDPFHSQ